MSAALAGIRSKVEEDSLTKSCRRRGCRVDMEGVPDCRVIVDMDKIDMGKILSTQHEEIKRCDFVLFLSAGDGGVLAVPIELKSGKVDASHAIEQLQSGAKLAARVSPRDVAITCHPILFHGKSIHPHERKTLRHAKIDFHGARRTTKTIKTARCGRPCNLADALGGG